MPTTASSKRVKVSATFLASINIQLLREAFHSRWLHHFLVYIPRTSLSTMSGPSPYKRTYVRPAATRSDRVQGISIYRPFGRPDLPPSLL